MLLLWLRCEDGAQSAESTKAVKREKPRASPFESSGNTGADFFLGLRSFL